MSSARGQNVTVDNACQRLAACEMNFQGLGGVASVPLTEALMAWILLMISTTKHQNRTPYTAAAYVPKTCHGILAARN
jgi:hypothetical protein